MVKVKYKLILRTHPQPELRIRLKHRGLTKGKGNYGVLATRKPMPMSRKSGSKWLRFDERQRLE